MEDYQYKLIRIEKTLSLTEFKNQLKRDVITIYSKEGESLIPHNNIHLDKGFSVLTIGPIYST